MSDHGEPPPESTSPVDDTADASTDGDDWQDVPADDVIDEDSSGTEDGARAHGDLDVTETTEQVGEDDAGKHDEGKEIASPRPTSESGVNDGNDAPSFDTDDPVSDGEPDETAVSEGGVVDDDDRGVVGDGDGDGVGDADGDDGAVVDDGDGAPGVDADDIEPMVDDGAEREVEGPEEPAVDAAAPGAPGSPDAVARKSEAEAASSASESSNDGSGESANARGPADRPGPEAQFQNAGEWVRPTTPRYYGDPFNAEYEAWTRQQTGGPEDGTEYLVRHNGEQAYFDATDGQDRGDGSTETLIDAKGRNEQFIDPTTGDFKDFWRLSNKSGLRAEIKQAERQVRVAAGRPVEWWCAEEATADAFNDAFANIRHLNGRIVAVYKPPQP